MSLDLIRDPWIPTTGPDGPSERSVAAVLTGAPELRALSATPATVWVAILRQVLLPIVLDAEGAPTSPEDWAKRFARGRFDADRISGYLDTHADRFDLFHPTQPFGQVAGLTATNGEVKSSGLLLPAQASGNNVPLYSASTEATPHRLTPAEATRWLLHVQCFDTAAIKSGANGDPKVSAGKTTGNPTGSVGRFGVVVPTGRNLFETLMLNLPIRKDGADPNDRPWWRRDPLTPAWEVREATGILDLLTWQSRRIRLIASADHDDSAAVESIVLCAGDRLSVFPDFEPHATWTIDAKPKANTPPRRPRAHRSGRSAWRGLDALLAVPGSEGTIGTVETSLLLRQVGDLQERGALDATYPLGVEVVGVEYGNQSAVIENIIYDSIPLPVVALRQDGDIRDLIERLASDADQLALLINKLEGDVKRSLGGELVPWDKGERASTRLIHLLDDPARRILAGLQKQPERYDDALDAWTRAATATTWLVAEEVLDQAAPTSYEGRVDDRDYRHNLSTAELRFRSGLRDLLGTLPVLDSTTDQEATA